jgi:sugar phosphate isomerase/epimerase
MKKIGLTCNTVLKRYGIDRGLEICKESGFDAIDFGFGSYTLKEGIYTASDDEFEAHFAAIKKKADDLELIISQTHGRTGTYWPNDEQHNADVDRYCELDLRASSILGSPSCVIHFINNTRWGKQTPEFLHQTSGEMFDKMIPFAETYKVNIALETFGAAKIQGARIRDFFADPREFKYQFDRLNTQYKTMCVDSGHTHEAESFWVPPPEEMIRILGKDVTILHLHDNNGHYDDHLLPGQGNINWPAVFESLEDIGYSGVYNFELANGFAGRLLEEIKEELTLGIGLHRVDLFLGQGGHAAFLDVFVPNGNLDHGTQPP